MAGRVEIVHAMFDGIIHQPVHFFLVDDIAVASRCRKCRPAHATITQQRNLILIGKKLAVSHLADGHSLSAFAGFFLVGRTTVKSRRGSHRTDADYFKEISSIHLFFLVHSLSIYKGKTNSADGPDTSSRRLRNRCSVLRSLPESSVNRGSTGRTEPW